MKAVATLPKDRIIAINCRSGKRSKNAARILVKNGYEVIELDIEIPETHPTFNRDKE